MLILVLKLKFNFPLIQIICYVFLLLSCLLPFSKLRAIPSNYNLRNVFSNAQLYTSSLSTSRLNTPPPSPKHNTLTSLLIIVYSFIFPWEPHRKSGHLLYCDVVYHVIGWASVNWWAPFWRWVTVSLYEVGCQLTARLLVKRYNVYIDLPLISWLGF